MSDVPTGCGFCTKSSLRLMLEDNSMSDKLESRDDELELRESGTIIRASGSGCLGFHCVVAGDAVVLLLT